MNDPIIVYVLSLVVAAFSLLSIALVVVYLKLLGKYQNLKEKLEKELGIVSLEETEKKAKAMLEDARVKAGEIMTHAQIFSTNEKNVLLEELNKSAKVYSQKYQESLKFAQDEAVRMIGSIPATIKSELMVRIEKFRTSIESDLVNSQKAISASVKEAYQKAEVEIEEYKLLRLKQVDESIMKIIEDVSRKVIAKEITSDEHEKLVTKALSEAKDQNIFLKEATNDK